MPKILLRLELRFREMVSKSFVGSPNHRALLMNGLYLEMVRDPISVDLHNESLKRYLGKMKAMIGNVWKTHIRDVHTRNFAEETQFLLFV